MIPFSRALRSPGAFAVSAMLILLIGLSGCGVSGSNRNSGGSGGSVTVTPAQYAFNPQTVGTTSAAANFTLTNGESGAINITGIQIAAPFGETNTCGSSVAAGQSCTISVTFAPTAPGPSAGTLSIADSGSNSPQNVAITGVGSPASGSGGVSLSPTQISFGNQVTGTTSAPSNVTLTNNGTGTLHIAGIQIAAPFAQTNTCGASLTAGQSCTIAVTFAPTAVGPSTGNLTITDDAAGSPQTVPLSGAGVAPPPPSGGATLTPAQYAFPNQTVGTVSANANFTLTNTQAAALNIASIQVGAPFAETNNCGASVAAGQSCTIAVTFAPINAGPANATLTVNDDAASSPQIAALTGTGTPAPGGAVTIDPTQYAFPTQAIGSSSPAANFTLTNGQSVTLNLASIQIAAPFTQTNNCGTALQAGQSCVIAVVYTPTVAGSDNATLSITDDAPGSPQTVAITGTAGTTGLSIVPKVGGLYFYNQIVNTSSTPLPVTLTNNNTGPVALQSITSAPDYPYTTTCVDSSGSGTLAPGASCTINVSFLPQAIGARPGNLTITESADSSPLSVPLQGTGIAGDQGLTVTVGPNKPCILPSSTEQFTAAVTGTPNTAVNWYVDGEQGGDPARGTITPTGLYTAPSTASLHTIQAISQADTTVNGNMQVTVTTTPQLGIYPFSASVATNAQQSFQAQLCRTPDNNAVTYTVDNIAGGNASVGTITPDGVYTAPATPGRHYVRATDTALGSQVTAAQVTVFSNIAVDFGSRLDTSRPVPANLLGYGRGESIQSTADRSLLTQAGVTVARLYAQIPEVYATQTPDWTQIDPYIQSVKDSGQRPLIQMSYAPPWLTPNPTPCDQNGPFAAPTDVNAWGQIAASYVAHFDATFPGLVQDYEIWNEPDAQGLCAYKGTQIDTYMSIYAAAAPLMKQQAAKDGTVIRIGGPVLSGDSANWITTLLTNPLTAPYVDFVSYHQYFFGPKELNVAWDTYNGNMSLYQATQDPSTGAAAVYNRVYGLVAAGKQPLGAKTPIYISEFNTNFGFFQDCCRNDPTYGPVWNALYITDMLNNVYPSATNATGTPIPAQLDYFAGNAYPYFCLIGVPDANSDCLYSSGATPSPYPQYYAFQLLSAPNYLGLVNGGYMATSVQPPDGGGGLAVAAFYTASQDSILITNPSGNDYGSVTVTVQNAGLATPTATLYSIAGGQSIQSSSLALTPAGTGFTATITVPKYSVQAISLQGSPAVP